MAPNPRDTEEPTPADLTAIEAEWPLIEADLSLLDAQIRALAAEGGPSPLDWRRLRRARRRALAAQVRHSSAPAGGTGAAA
jgi:hypothetical protein